MKFNNTTVEKCVHNLFVDQVKLNPNKTAAKINDSYITYFELNYKSDCLADMLRSKSIGANPPIGIAIERSIDLIIAVIATLKSGAACVPLDINYPENRLDFMAKDSGMNVLLTTKKVTELYPYLENLSTNCTTFFLDSIEYQSKDDSLNKGTSCVSLDDLVYILYTSGSTGKPKGVAMPHRALSNLIYWQLNDIDPEKIPNTLQFSPISFDVSFQEIFSTLCSGQTLILLNEETRKDPNALFELLKKENISRIFLPTVVLQQLAKVAKGRVPLTALNTVITAGEQLQITQDIELFFTSIPDASLYNHYGPTETHVVTSYKLSNENKNWPLLPPIGFPISNIEAYILDENRRKVELGSVGELYLGGDCLAKGYHNSPELTRDRFVPNPFADGLLYKTGDLACSKPDGAIHFLGRSDSQVKIRGFRIELGEIEILLLQYPKIKECIVTDCEVESGNKSLIAYIVVNMDFENELNVFNNKGFAYKMAPRALFFELKNHLSKNLPDYMLPSYFTIIRKIPLTPSGKVDRSALPLPSILNTKSIINFMKLSSKTIEEKITYAWEEILQIRPISNNENFFDLGGYSLLVVLLHGIFSEVFEHSFSVIALFKNPTISSQVNFFNTGHNAIFQRDNKRFKKQVLSQKSIDLRRSIRGRSQKKDMLNE